MRARVALLIAVALGWHIPLALANVKSPAIPQPARPGDIVGLILQNASSTASARKLITFGQIFAAGQLAENRALQADIGGHTEPVQMDIKNRYPDHSVKFAILTLAAPPLAASSSVPMMLREMPAALKARDVDLSADLAQHDLRMTVTFQDGEAPVTIDAARLLAASIADHTASDWLAGPLATEKRVSQRIAGSLRLVLDLRAYANGSLDADIQFNNDIAMRQHGGTARYGVTIMQAGKVIIAMPPIVQYQYQDWHTIIRSDGRSTINVMHDVAAMERAYAIPAFDLGYGIDDQIIASDSKAIAEPGWDRPLAADGVLKYMPTTGGRDDIGPTTKANAAWLISQNPTSAVYAIGQADAAGAVPWHMFDLRTGQFLTLTDYPTLWADPRGGPGSYTVGLTQPVDQKNLSWTADNAHEPDLSFIPYMLTGRRYYRDQMDAEASWDELSAWPAAMARKDGQGIVVGPGNQVRGSAWSLRSLAEAAYIDPDGSASQAYFETMLDHNLAYLVSEIPKWTAEQGEATGYLPGAYGASGAMAPWEQDFFATTIGLIAARGHPAAIKIVDWEENFIAGRFLSSAAGFNPRDGIAYNLIVFDVAKQQDLTSWQAIEQYTAKAGESNGNSWQHSQGYYGQTALAALASFINATGSKRAESAYRWLSHSGAPFINPDSLAQTPQYWIVPLRPMP
jgi:hypothetical protein